MRSSQLNLSNVVIDSTGWASELCESMTEFNQQNSTRPRQLLLIDDDSIFCKRLERAAKKNHIKISTFNSIDEFQALGLKSKYDAAIIDYYLGDTTAPQIIPLFKGIMPVVLISEGGGPGISDAPWPSPVKRFVSKSRGLNVVLNEALNVANLEIAAKNASTKPERIWMIAAVLAYILCTTLVLSLTWILSARPMNKLKTPFRWDSGPVTSTIVFLQTNATENKTEKN